jgi:uncharacterized protein involved in type VI secretion and phage assembly
MDSFVSILQQIASHEAGRIYTTEMGEVTSILPHAADSDKHNYQCAVRIKSRKAADGSDFELRGVPVAAGYIGMANIPKVGDLVLLQFIGGDLNAPVITGRLYNDTDKPPVSDQKQLVLERMESIQITMNDSTSIGIDKDGNVKIKGQGDIILKKGSKGAARKDDSVEVTIPPGTFITTVAGNAVGTPNPNPVKVQGKITSASGTVKIGD